MDDFDELMFDEDTFDITTETVVLDIPATKGRYVPSNKRRIGTSRNKLYTDDEELLLIFAKYIEIKGSDYVN